jgi:hypothetical protein
MASICRASSAIRYCFVDASTGFDAPAMFASNGVMRWRPLLSTGSLGIVPPLHPYHGSLRHPRRPGLSLAGFRFQGDVPLPPGFPVWRCISFFVHRYSLLTMPITDEGGCPTAIDNARARPIGSKFSLSPFTVDGKPERCRRVWVGSRVELPGGCSDTGGRSLPAGCVAIRFRGGLPCRRAPGAQDHAVMGTRPDSLSGDAAQRASPTGSQPSSLPG